MVKTIFSKTDFFSKIFQSARNSHKVLPRTFKNNHKEIEEYTEFKTIREYTSSGTLVFTSATAKTEALDTELSGIEWIRFDLPGVKDNIPGDTANC